MNRIYLLGLYRQQQANFIDWCISQPPFNASKGKFSVPIMCVSYFKPLFEPDLLPPVESLV
ncbi:hypothetical protein [Nostoc sp.]